MTTRDRSSQDPDRYDNDEDYYNQVTRGDNMINVLQLKSKAPNVYNDLLEAVGDPNDKDREDKVLDMSFFTALDTYLKYNGIIGYTQDIINAVDTLREVTLPRER